MEHHRADLKPFPKFGGATVPSGLRRFQLHAAGTWPGSTGVTFPNRLGEGAEQARIQGVGAGARAHPWGGVSPFKNALFNSIQAPVHHWAPTPGRNPVSAPAEGKKCSRHHQNPDKIGFLFRFYPFSQGRGIYFENGGEGT